MKPTLCAADSKASYKEGSDGRLLLHMAAIVDLIDDR